MFSAKQLSSEQISILHQRAADGASMADIQKCVKEEFGHSITYMDTRFLVLDLGIQLREETKAAEPEKTEEPKAPPVPTGTVEVSIDTLMLPGALVSGKVVFSDGESAVWLVDQNGRVGLDPETAGYRPSQEDSMLFQQQLRALLQKGGY